MPSKNNLKNSLSGLKNTQEIPNIQPILNPEKTTTATTSKQKIKRINKGFQIEEKRAHKWDLLVAQMKGAGDKKRTGPELMDEALDYLFKKYM
ncbi:MAG: hypothetical protein DHS20C09_18960 [marine bacterium B5-7]|nr:MAG: hypothetical protein DHS20C09_18960 [marine bacterium B5-7]